MASTAVPGQGVGEGIYRDFRNEASMDTRSRRDFQDSTPSAHGSPDPGQFSSAGMAQLTTRHVCRVSCLTSSHRVCPMRRAMTVQMTAPRHRSHYPRAIRQEKKLPQTERVSLGAGLSSANHRTCQGHQTPVTLQPSGCRLDSPSISRRLMRKVATSRLSMACGMFQ